MTRVAVITGAAAGLGRACASRLAADGLRLVLVDADAVAVSAVADELASIGAEIGTCIADIRDRQACQVAIATAVERFGRVDVLVNAAGVYPRRPVLEISADDWQFVFQVNVLGTYFMMTAAIADMCTRGRGHIVNISSIDGFKAHPANAHYAATKAAVISLTRSLALEVAPLGILVNSVGPGTDGHRCGAAHRLVRADGRRTPNPPADRARRSRQTCRLPQQLGQRQHRR